MTKTYDIKDTITKNDNDYQKFELDGKIIVDDSGWFEGYLKNAYLKKPIFQFPEDYIFIFGIYHPNGVLDLYSYNQYWLRPAIFKGEFKDSEYVGVMEHLYAKYTNDYIDHLSISESNSDIDDLSEITTLLETVFNLRRSSICDDKVFCDFYYKVYDNRIALSDILVKANKGITFTEEDKMTARHLNNEKREARHAIKVYMLNR